MERKVARICWNDKYWTKPSGSDGKTRNSSSYEHSHGFGHEEWLLDLDKVIDGYHYGYLQAIGTNREKYLDSAFNVSLYTIDNRSKQRWWLGGIENLEVVSPKESARIYEEYKRRGWLEEMRSDLREVGGSIITFDKDVTPEIFAVIRFRPDATNLNVPPLEFEHGDPAVPSAYYNLKNYITEPKYLANVGGFVFIPGYVKPAAGKKRTYGARDVDVSYHHTEIQEALYSELCNEYGAKNVGAEQLTPSGTKIDLVAKAGDKFVLYEVKVGLSAKACVREALGQLFEYRYDIGAHTVSELVIVSSHGHDSGVDKYLAALVEQHRLPVRYQRCVP